MHDRAFLSWTCGIALAWTVACGSAVRTISLDNRDAGGTILAAVGDTIEVTLQTIGPGQFETPVVSSTAVVFLSESQVGAPNPAGPTQLFRFEVVGSGRADIAIPHSAAGAGGPPIPAFTVTVEVP